jgi:hypothetical protein
MQDKKELRNINKALTCHTKKKIDLDYGRRVGIYEIKPSLEIG